MLDPFHDYLWLLFAPVSWKASSHLLLYLIQSQKRRLNHRVVQHLISLIIGCVIISRLYDMLKLYWLPGIFTDGDGGQNLLDLDLLQGRLEYAILVEPIVCLLAHLEDARLDLHELADLDQEHVHQILLLHVVIEHF